MTEALAIEGLVVQARAPSGEWFETVRNVDLQVGRSEVVALIGESGAGKTTVALAALGYARPGTRILGGRVRLGDTDVLALSARQRREIRGRRIAYVAQSAAASLNPAITIGEQIDEAAAVHGLTGRAGSKSGANGGAVELLDLLKLPMPERLVKRYPHQLSGGQQQRVMVAMSLVCRPEFLVFDEPTTALDVTTQIEVLAAIKEALRETNGSAIYVSHDLAVVAQVADRIQVLRNGTVIEEGPAAKIVTAPRESYTRQLLEAVRPPPALSRPSMAVAAPTRTEETEREASLRARGICASYARPAWWRPRDAAGVVLRDVSIEVEKGVVVALVGESGSGKSTLARVIAGLHPPLEGAVKLGGTILAGRAKKRSLDQLRRLQIVFQSPDTALNPEERIADVLGRPLDLYFDLNPAARRARVDELLSMVRLPTSYALRYPAELSGGERQRISLARAFAADPDIVICDEVLSSLDTLVSAAILDLLKDLQCRSGVGCLFISHDLATVASIAQRVSVLYAGELCESGPTAEVFAPPHHPYTALLLSSVPELRTGWLEDVMARRRAATDVDTPVPSAGSAASSGCPFHLRCPLAIPGRCAREPAPARHLGEAHVVHCHLDAEELRLRRGESRGAPDG